MNPNIEKILKEYDKMVEEVEKDFEDKFCVMLERYTKDYDQDETDAKINEVLNFLRTSLKRAYEEGKNFWIETEIKESTTCLEHCEKARAESNALWKTKIEEVMGEMEEIDFIWDNGDCSVCGFASVVGDEAHHCSSFNKAIRECKLHLEGIINTSRSSGESK